MDEEPVTGRRAFLRRLQTQAETLRNRKPLLEAQRAFHDSLGGYVAKLPYLRSEPAAHPEERRLTTILSADVVGYSRMMGEDEAGTLGTLNLFRAVMAKLIGAHRGRIVGTAGDSVLAEFTSVVRAVDCAVRIQRELAQRNQAIPAGRQMWFRIGINLGDVLVERNDLFG